RAAHKSEAAALALEVRPRAHQTALLIDEMRMLDLQRAFAGAGALAENLQNETGAVEHLRVPRLLEIALLHGRDRAVHDDQVDIERLGDAGNLIDLAFAEIGRGADFGDRHQPGLDDIESDGAREADRLFEPCGGRSLARFLTGSPAPGGASAQIR